jgi:hypothetical protein
MGLFFEKYLPKTDRQALYDHPFHRFYQSLKALSNRAINRELKGITGRVASAENHLLYERILKIFIRDWQLDFEKASFIGMGVGDGSLDTHRKVTIGNKHYFEKVYFNYYRDLQTAQWFQKYIYELIEDEITAPPIRKTYRGTLLTVAYYDYLKLAKLEKETRKSRLLQFSKDLYLFSCSHESYLANLEPPGYIKNFRDHFIYRWNIDLAEAVLLKEGIEANHFEELLNRSECVLTHGDINEGNGYKNGVLIDWDLAGIYPVGFDPAYIYFRLPIKSEKDIGSWLEEHYGAVILEEDWDDFERNFIYFLFVFSAKRFDMGRFEQLERQLIEKLKTYKIESTLLLKDIEE